MTDTPADSPLAKVSRELQKVAVDLHSSGAVTLEELEELKGVLDSIEHGEKLEEASLQSIADARPEDAESGDIRSQLRDMGIPQKVKLAMFGNATCRMLLISDSNRLVQEAVLKNPQIQEREVHEFAKNSNVSDNVLRRISDSKTWMKSYIIKLNLVLNPKTPQDISLKWLRYLRQPDLKRIGGSKNIPQVIATAAKKRIADMQQRK